MMERRIGIWAAIFFLVIASRGCSGGQADVSAAEKARNKLTISVVHYLEEALPKDWNPDAWSFYNISLGAIEMAAGRVSRSQFQSDLFSLDSGILENKMEQVKATVLFESNKCLLFEATAPGDPQKGEPPFNFLYQLILDGNAESPKVNRAFILGGETRPISQYIKIYSQLKRTITNPKQYPLSGILTNDYPQLALQVLDEKSCDPYEEKTRIGASDSYEANFLFLFGKSYELEVTAPFEGDKHIQFNGGIWSKTLGKTIYAFLMAATVVEVGGHDKVQSIHIMVEKYVAEDSGEIEDDRIQPSAEVSDDSGKTTDDQLSAGSSQSAEVSDDSGETTDDQLSAGSSQSAEAMQTDVSAAEKARDELVMSVVYHLEKAVKENWLPESRSSYNILYGSTKLAGDSQLRDLFARDLSELDDELKGEMKEVKATVIFESNKCLVVEANQDSHQPHFNVFYQLILHGDAESPKVSKAFILGGQKRAISHYKVIFKHLGATITSPWGLGLSHILTDDHPLLALQVLDGEECKTYEERTIIGASDTYEKEFLSLFGDSYTITETSSFEGDKHIQFTGDISSKSGKPICTFRMAATVVKDGGHHKVQSIHIIVKKEVAEDSGEIEDGSTKVNAGDAEDSGEIGDEWIHVVAGANQDDLTQPSAEVSDDSGEPENEWDLVNDEDAEDSEKTEGGRNKVNAEVSDDSGENQWAIVETVDAMGNLSVSEHVGSDS